MKKRFEGRDEPILDPEIPIVDVHHHLFIRPGVRYLLDDYLEDVALGHRIVASVYSETMAFARPDGEELMRPVGEVEFANGIGAMCESGLYGGVRVCAAIVGHADMRHGDDVARLLDRCLETAPDRYRGVRQITLEHSSDLPFAFMPKKPPAGVLTSTAFREAYRHLGPRGLLFDFAAFSDQLPDVAVIADAFPETTITLNHLGMAMGLGLSPLEREDLFVSWRTNLSELAKRPNVFCKVGGMGLPFWGFGFETREDPIGYRELAEAWKPWVETGIGLFGYDRCMAESDFPPDGRSCGFVPALNALKSIVSGATAQEKADLFSRTAARVHRITLAHAGPAAGV